MKVLVLGATGGTGRAIVRELRSHGHAPIALVRSLAAAGNLDATLVQGDAREKAALDRALDGCEAVISALGTPMSPFREVALLSQATRALIAIMKRKGVPRLICITGLGAGNSRGHGGLLFDRLVMPLLLRKVYADKDRQETLVSNSTLDWVLVRPTVLTDKPAQTTFRALTDLTDLHAGKIARADVATFDVQLLQSDEWLRQAPLITC